MTDNDVYAVCFERIYLGSRPLADGLNAKGLKDRELREMKKAKEYNTWDSNVVPHRSTNQARTCLTSLSGREAVLSCWYGRIQ